MPHHEEDMYSSACKAQGRFFDEEADRMQQLVDGRGAVWHANVQAQNDCCTLELIVAMTT